MCVHTYMCVCVFSFINPDCSWVGAHLLPSGSQSRVDNYWYSRWPKRLSCRVVPLLVSRPAQLTSKKYLISTSSIFMTKEANVRTEFCYIVLLSKWYLKDRKYMHISLMHNIYNYVFTNIMCHYQKATKWLNIIKRKQCYSILIKPCLGLKLESYH